VDSTERLVRLINDILDIERMESGKVQMVKQACNAADLMAKADVMQAMADKAGGPYRVQLYRPSCGLTRSNHPNLD